MYGYRVFVIIKSTSPHTNVQEPLTSQVMDFPLKDHAEDAINRLQDFWNKDGRQLGYDISVIRFYDSEDSSALKRYEPLNVIHLPCPKCGQTEPGVVCRSPACARLQARKVQDEKVCDCGGSGDGCGGNGCTCG
jgi:hypothetical protein